MGKSLEWFGALTAIAFSLLGISAIAIGLWAFLGKHYGILLLQFFYATAGIIGVLRWL